MNTYTSEPSILTAELSTSPTQAAPLSSLNGLSSPLLASAQHHRITCLTDLPSEIIDHICLHLRFIHIGESRSHRSQSAKKGLWSLCLTSRELYQLALPHLYYYIRINELEDELVPLDASFSMNKQLAAFVQVLEDRWVSETNPSHMKAEYHRRTHARILRRALVPRLENLHTLDMTFEILSGRFAGTANLDVLSPDTSHSFDQLRNLVLRYVKSFGRPVAIHGFARSLNGKMIESLTITEKVSFACVEEFYLPALRELRLQKGILTMHEVRDLVEWCPNLELFHLGTGGDMDPFHLSNALRPLAETLHTMIALNGHRPHSPGGCLAGFGRLRNLMVSVAQGYIPFIESASTTLEHLVILYHHKRDIEDVMIGKIQSLAERARTSFPNLKTVLVNYILGLDADFVGSSFIYHEDERLGTESGGFDPETSWIDILAELGYGM